MRTVFARGGPRHGGSDDVRRERLAHLDALRILLGLLVEDRSTNDTADNVPAAVRMACADGSNDRASSLGPRPTRTSSTMRRRNSGGIADGFGIVDSSSL